MSKTHGIWRNVFASILVVCLLGFLSGVGMLHGMTSVVLAALALTLALAGLWLGAIVFTLADLKNLGMGRLFTVLLVPPLAWYGTVTMTDRYPYFISRIYFHNHFKDYQEAVNLAKANLATEKVGRFRLPKRLSELAIDGEVSVVKADGSTSYDFYVGHGFASRGPIIRFVSGKDRANEDEAAEKLADGWTITAR